MESMNKLFISATNIANTKDSEQRSILQGLILGVIVIVGFVIIFYIILRVTSHISSGKLEFAKFDQIPPPIAIVTDPQPIVTYISSQNSEPEQSDSEISDEISVPIVTDPLPIVNSESEQSDSEFSVVQDNACDWKMDKVKTIYKKEEPVYYPASLGVDGYMSRDVVCYRERAGDVQFISKRPGCMACTVNDDGSINKKTETNIKTTCVYGSDADALLDASIWSEQKCITECNKITN